MLDFAPVREKKLSFADVTNGLTKADLYTLTNEMIDTMLHIIADAVDEDVVFVPQDPHAKDTFGIPEEADLAWTLGHVIVHATASSEESEALASTLALGLPLQPPSRSQMPCPTAHNTPHPP